jgi:hypothetical protein
MLCGLSKARWPENPKMSTAPAYPHRSGLRWVSMFRALKVRLRFSLRELLLFTMVVAAFTAWLLEIRKEQRPPVPSHIAEYFTNSLQQDIAAVRSELGEGGEPWSFAPPVSRWSGLYKPEHSVNREWFCELHLPWAKAQAFRDKLNSRVRSHMRIGIPGEPISSSEHEGDAQTFTPSYLADATKYHCADVHGIIRVFLTRIDDQNLQLVALLNEHRVP